MPYNEYILPLLGGYLFLRIFNVTSYRLGGLNGYVVLLEAAVAGVAFLFASNMLQWLLATTDDAEALHKLLLPLAVPAFLSGFYGAYLLIRRSIQKPNYYSELTAEAKALDDYGRAENFRRGMVFALIGILVFVATFAHAIVDLRFLADWRVLLASIVCTLATTIAVRWLRNRSKTRSFELALGFSLGLIILIVFLIAAVTMREMSSTYWMGLNETYEKDVPGIYPLSFGLAVFTALLLNRIVDWRTALAIKMNSGGIDAVETLLYRMGISIRPIMVTLLDSKVYIGFVDRENPIKGRADKYFIIVPISSGYRCSSDQRVKLTTFYTETFRKFVQDKKRPTELKRALWGLRKVIGLERIASIGPFDPKAYEEFLKTEKLRKQKEAAAKPASARPSQKSATTRKTKKKARKKERTAPPRQ